MRRNLNIAIITDATTPDLRTLVADISSAIDTPQSVVTPQLLHNVLPRPDGSVVGILIWSTDLQGLKSDIASFASYLVNEDGVRGALQELGIKASVDGTN